MVARGVPVRIRRIDAGELDRGTCQIQLAIRQLANRIQRQPGLRLRLGRAHSAGVCSGARLTGSGT